MHTYITSIALSYMRILHIEVAYTNCLASNLNTYVGKTLVLNFGALFAHPSTDGKLYYNSSLSLNESIDLTSISL